MTCGEEFFICIKNSSPHVIYLNFYHRLVLCFTHLMWKLPGLPIIDLYLITLQKTFHYSKENSFILQEIQIVCDMKACKVAKGATCKKCHKRCYTVTDALDFIIPKFPKQEHVSLRALLLDENRRKQMMFLEDVCL